jgi:hypothetical protein
MDSVLLAERGVVALTEREMLMLATVEPILRKAQLSFYCPRCYFTGKGDGGVRGNNSMDDTRWTIECQCCVRMSTNPTAHAKTVA